MLIVGKRYAVLLHRIQAPERVSSPPPNRVVRPVPVSNTNPPVPAEPTTDTPATNGTPVTPVAPVTPVVTATTTATGDDDRPFTLREFIYNNPGVRCESTPFPSALGITPPYGPYPPIPFAYVVMDGADSP